MNKTVNILGAGISGLSCAIILAKNGCKVNVYESQKTVGTRFNNDWQGIENWSEDIDVLEQIRSFGIKTDFCHEPLNHINFHVGKEENCVDLKDSRAAAYLVRRGKTEESLDNCLLEQAKSLGACVFFGTGKDYLKKDDITIDINATGPKKASIIARGITFGTESEDDFHIAYNNRIAKDFYSYLIIKKGHGTIAAVLNKKCANQGELYLERTIDYFSDYVDMDDICNGRKFGGIGYFDIKKNLRDDNDALLIGEAGGFQDFLWGFGMRYAIQTANYAAQSIINDEDYERLIRKHIHKKMRKSLRNRRLCEYFGRHSYNLMYLALKKSKHPLKVLKYMYR